jgi:hypothetical protein
LPIFAEMLLDAMTKNKKKAKKKVPSSAPSVEDLLRVGQGVGTPIATPSSLLDAGQGVGTPLTLGQDYGPGSPAAIAATGNDPLTASTRAALERALASLGGGPDRNAYVAPFDQAEARAREAHAAAVPTIAGQYADMTRGLGDTQRAQQAQAQQTQANQAAAMASQQQLLQKLQAPVLADLQAQGGQAAVGSLTGALQASMAAGQAGVGAAGAAQQQLSQNLANAQQQSYDSRIQDARLAEEAAQGNASQNLNSILNQIGVQRAGAERQYGDDVQRLHAQRQQIDLQLAQLQDAGRASAQQAMDPARQLNQLQATDQLAAYQQQRNAPPVYQLLDTWRQDNPSATSLLESVYGQSDDQNEAYSILAEMARSQAKQFGGQFIKYDGKRISVQWIKAKLDELYGGAQ